MQIDINGTTYKPKKQPKQSAKMSKLMLMALMFGGLDSGLKSRKRPQVDIIEEFKLIQKKESKLSRNDRDWVVFQFHKRFEPA